MASGLENRLRKLEKTVRAKEEETDQGAWREQFRELRSTPEGRKLLRKLSMESAEQMLDKFQAEERAKITAITQPERLVDLKKQWAEEDAKDKARRKKLAEWREWMEARGSVPCDCRECARVETGTGS